MVWSRGAAIGWRGLLDGIAWCFSDALVGGICFDANRQFASRVAGSPDWVHFHVRVAGDLAAAGIGLSLTRLMRGRHFPTASGVTGLKTGHYNIRPDPSSLGVNI